MSLLCQPMFRIQWYQVMQGYISKTMFRPIVLLALIVFGSVPSYASTPSIMILGDSISAAYGIPTDKGWVKLLQDQLSHQHSTLDYQVINASISGETTGGALTRLPKLLKMHQPNIVIIELGGNDGLRGFPIMTLRNNLDQLISLSQTAGAKVLIAGMRIPPNYGPRYTSQFYDSYRLAAQKFQVALVPFLLDEIAQHPELMQRDGIHPTEEAQPKILQNVLPVLQSLI
jgi:acyl-CoA thioesterase-1